MDAVESLSDQEAKIASLERANFDLKMQVFYLNKKISDGALAESDPDQAAINVNLIEDRSVDIIGLRDELEFAKNRIEELESEVFQLQLIRDNEALEYQKLLQTQPSNDISLLEESRRRERDIAKTIAEHDAALISKLRLEVDSLQQQHERDSKLVEDCTERLTNQMEIQEVTNAELERLREANTELSDKVTVLTDTARQQERLLTEATSSRIDPQVHDLLRKENTQLKEQVERQKTAIAHQAEALSKLSTASAEESQDMIRLATELDVCCTARDDAVLQSQRLKYENEVLRVQLHELKSIYALGQSATAMGAAADLSSSTYQHLLSASGAGSGLLDTKLAEAYKKREAELLAALEAVIQRCKELELAQYQQQVLSEPHQNGNGYGNGAALPSGSQPNARRAQTANGSASAITPSGIRGRSANADYSDRPPQAAQASRQQLPPPPPQQSSSADRSRSKSAERRQSRAWH